jgi:hypothetical protein
MSQSEKRANFRHVFDNFFGCILSKLFQRIRNQRKILRFLIPVLNLINFFGALISTFLNFDCTCAGNGSKNRKIFVYKCALEFY